MKDKESNSVNCVFDRELKIHICDDFYFVWDNLHYYKNDKKIATVIDELGNELILTTRGDVVIDYKGFRFHSNNIGKNTDLVNKILTGSVRRAEDTKVLMENTFVIYHYKNKILINYYVFHERPQTSECLIANLQDKYVRYVMPYKVKSRSVFSKENDWRKYVE